ncbi:aminoglycoside O-phosphotransferase [Virgisporangium aliadipatigenens]|uniref:Aminoglycoside O-phosphotransferase n=1 Tax=Virgisporangium aliadipatigenens TaxID=741659 RepID=A0A8J3YLE7_9ACTN|nr:aminoglycoside phosphotransferase family protein [Virgisporangium aliadipatigenens]GIJ46263.1 aminoglycoside O-phosphotransferase [Virgisporangium aliadipatigenens]
MTVPPARLVAGVGRTESGRRWLADLPALVARVGLELGTPFEAGACSYAAPAVLADGTPVVVKITWPHREMVGEAAALRHWAGRGAVRLIAHDPVDHVLILERCDPGIPVTDLRTGCAVLRRLRETPPPSAGFEDLRTVASEWADLLVERHERLRPDYDPGVVAEGARLLRALSSSTERVLLHGDLNPGNILAHDGGWVAIDPKPMLGDPAYDPWPLIDQLPTPALPERLRIAADALDLDAARIARWGAARAVEEALWHAAHGTPEDGATLIAAARRLLNFAA